MCGFSGIINDEDFNQHEIKSINELLNHRGPDSTNYFQSKVDKFNIYLGHKRLSIIDLSKQANQPMKFEELAIVYNGEMYNFKNIRSKLEKIGYIFQTKSDTEVVLKAFHCWKEKCVDEFEGMYSFVIFDKENKKFFLFRDPMGVKPLYYFYDEKNLVFSSEARSIYKYKNFKKTLNKDSINLYFQYGFLETNDRFFNNLKQLEPSTIIEFSLNQKIHLSNKIKYNNIEKNYYSYKNKNCHQELKNLLIESCERRMVADVPIGCFLSGGTDSSLISYIITKELNKKISTFTVCDTNLNMDDYKNSEKIANYLKTDHYILNLKNQRKDLNNIIYNYGEIFDEPFADISAIPNILVSKLARSKVKVVLSGDGADEIFAGYPKYSNIIRREEKLKKLNPKLRQIFLRLFKAFENFDGINNKLFYKKILLHLISNNPKHLLDLYNSFEFNRKLILNSYDKSQKQDEINYNKNNLLSTLLNLDLNNYFPNNILFKLDRSTMSQSLEGREPFLDKKIISYSYYLQKNNENLLTNKTILKDIRNNLFEGKYVNKKKEGFVMSYKAVMNKNTKKFLDNFFEKKFLLDQGIFDYNILNKLYLKNYKSTADYKTLYNIICFQSWFKRWM